MAGIFFIPNIPQHIQVHPKISSGSKTGSVLINPTAAGWAPWTRDWDGKTMHLATSFFSAFFLEPFPNYQKYHKGFGGSRCTNYLVYLMCF